MKRFPALLAAAAMTAAAGAGLPASAAAPVTTWAVGTSGALGQSKARALALTPTSVGTACGGGGAGTVTITWTTMANATSYLLQYSTISSATGFDAGTVVSPTAGTTSYVFDAGGLLATYYFRVWSNTGGWRSTASTSGNSPRTFTLGLICS